MESRSCWLAGLLGVQLCCLVGSLGVEDAALVHSNDAAVSTGSCVQSGCPSPLLEGFDHASLLQAQQLLKPAPSADETRQTVSNPVRNATSSTSDVLQDATVLPREVRRFGVLLRQVAEQVVVRQRSLRRSALENVPVLLMVTVGLAVSAFACVVCAYESCSGSRKRGARPGGGEAARATAFASTTLANAQQSLPGTTGELDKDPFLSSMGDMTSRRGGGRQPRSGVCC